MELPKQLHPLIRVDDPTRQSHAKRADCVGQCDRTLVTTIGNTSVTVVAKDAACQNPMPVLIVIWTRIVGYLAASWVNVED